MRKEFTAYVERIAKENKKLLFLTGDLGFMALEGVRTVMGERFINCGVNEQNIITVAAALASEGFTPMCYSIAPFIVFRPAEQIRLDVCLHNMNVKIVGNGGGYGYGIMGSTHHAIEDIGVLSSFQNMKCFIPYCNQDVETTAAAMMAYEGPSYLRLGAGINPDDVKLKEFEPIRKLKSGNGVTVVGLGPVVLNALKAVQDSGDDTLADVFVVSQMPFDKLSSELEKSLIKNKKLVVIEEHVATGGLGERLANMVVKKGLTIEKYKHLYAQGYPDGLYGSQKYHQSLSMLDAKSILKVIRAMR